MILKPTFMQFDLNVTIGPIQVKCPQAFQELGFVYNLR